LFADINGSIELPHDPDLEQAGAIVDSALKTRQARPFGPVGLVAPARTNDAESRRRFPTCAICTDKLRELGHGWRAASFAGPGV
jgi:hypothetical protein